MSGTMTRVAALSAALLGVLVAGWAVDVSAVASAKGEARQPADAAAKLSGTWVLNRELSKGFGAPVRGRREPANMPAGRPRSGALFAASATAAPSGTVSAVPQRGGGGGGSSDATDLTPEQRAEQAAMRALQQIEARITIKASADAVTFIDSRGEHTFAVDGKTGEMMVASSPVKVKSKWDKQVLKQEFTNPQAKLVETWSIDGADHLVLTAKVESLKFITPERKAVFDRQ